MNNIENKTDGCTHEYLKGIKIIRKSPKIYLLGECGICEEQMEIPNNYRKVRGTINFYKLIK